MSAIAIEYAVNGWAVFPLRGKAPAYKQIHPEGLERQTCKGQCGRIGHGLYDATTDAERVAELWSGRYGDCNIGARVPESMFVLDVDDLDGLAELESSYGVLPATLTTISGRAAGGRHLYFRRPQGKLSHRRLPKGLEIKTSTGYTVQAPSIHPDTGTRYERIDAPVAAPPSWLVALLRPLVPANICQTKPLYGLRGGPSIADEFAVKASWATILGVHGWQCLDADPDGDGARWLHPAATSKCSATIRNGCLFVYSPNTAFDVTEPGNPSGYTKFRAYAVLDHGGDMRAAARALQGVRQ
ncbi:bifunctional DNA primase/polymerase [Mycolicibacterium hippocampi]|nr:bifunctional DNA primase/polymerase [Mycolicibacterium hippocampi]